MSRVAPCHGGLGNDELKHRYLWGEAVDQLLADENLEFGVCYFPQADLQGSIVSAGAYSPALNQFGGYNTVDYDAFGRIVGQLSTTIRFRYTGQEWDADAGLYYYNARWYDPHTGQFLSQDPLGFAAGDANLYRYVGNNVTNLTDPSGLFGWTNVWGVVNAIGGGLMMVGGAAIATAGTFTGLGAAPAVVGGGLVAAKGLDNFQAGVRQAFTGEDKWTLTKYAAWEASGRDETIADMVDLGTDLAAAIPNPANWARAPKLAMAGAGGSRAMANTLRPLPLQRILEADLYRLGGAGLKVETRLAGSLVVTDNACSPTTYCSPAKEVGEPNGQIHHPISKPVFEAIEEHPNLAGKYLPRDPRFTSQAIDKAAHNGWQTWHRELDAEVAQWLRDPRNGNATKAGFEAWLRWRYSQPDLTNRFPNGF